ncbi:hypothetical protein HKD37_09G025086 [Glycine soja]|uniref:Uncharacterized protein n=1 Tax=Glycine soja TaxID=3848 RepID=A0A445IZB3_GLYSO|nr:hypothetical protein GmHk_09G025467 [Glycine max]RZB91458.1 hypothetical protein D0Y65_023748 [Glycine soja]
MATPTPIVPWSFLVDDVDLGKKAHVVAAPAPKSPKKDTFVQALGHACTIPLSQLPVPYLKLKEILRSHKRSIKQGLRLAKTTFMKGFFWQKVFLPPRFLGYVQNLENFGNPWGVGTWFQLGNDIDCCDESIHPESHVALMKATEERPTQYFCCLRFFGNM